MKKILMTMVAAFAAVSMNAQVYVGGSLSFWSNKGDKAAVGYADKSETTFKIMPEIGYNLNEEWAIGAVIGYENNKWNGVSGEFFSESAFTFNPYARYTFANLGKVNFFVDGGVDFKTYSKADGTTLGIGFKPGLAVNVTDELSFVTKVGFIGWKQTNPDGDDNNINKFGLDLNGSNLSFGLFYNF